MRRHFLLLLCLPLMLLTACAGYKLGTGVTLPFRTLYVAPAESSAKLPQARAVVSKRIREAFLRDARVTLVNSEQEADAVLRVNLVSYERDAVVSQDADTGLARKFALTLQAECTLTLHDGRELMSKRLVKAQREDYVDGGQLQAEYEMVPVLAEKLATSVTHAVLDTW